MKHLSLFSGIGGLDLAAEMAGFATVGQCEWADYPTKVLEKHWPDVPRWRDIRTLTGESFYEKTGIRTVDVISGGFPCQPFSVAGKRRGKEDDRYLWPEMLRVISELRPTWVVGENVAGIVNMALDQVYSDLENEGYSVQALIIPACAVDAPHRRDRCAIVGRKTDVPNPNKVRCDLWGSERERVRGDAPRHEADTGGKNVEDADGNGCGRPRDLCELRCVQKEVGKGEANFPCKPSQVPGTMAHADHGGRLVRRGGELPAVEETGESRTDHGGRAQKYVAGEWWPAEPNVGRSLDGVPCWLDGIGGLSNEAKERAREILRNLREETVSETVQWTIGRFNSISKAEVLLAFLCEYEEECNGSRVSLESRTISERKLRDLWRTIEFARTSHRREYHSQLAREYSDTLFRLSHGAPSLMSEAWEDNTWENGIERIATGVPARVDRLKCLGNAVVPQQFYPIFKAIALAEQWGGICT